MAEGLSPPITGTEARLELILAELRGLRADLQQAARPAEIVPGAVELREPATPAIPAPKRPRRTR